MAWILLLWLSTGYSASSFSVEFADKQACESAAEKFIEKMQEKGETILLFQRASYVCVPKKST